MNAWAGTYGNCQMKQGFLFWKKPCGQPRLGACEVCGLPICGKHTTLVDPGLRVCDACLGKYRSGLKIKRHYRYGSSGGSGAYDADYNGPVYGDPNFGPNDAAAFAAADASGNWSEPT